VCGGREREREISISGNVGKMAHDLCVEGEGAITFLIGRKIDIK
jgi:hypothetical protein